MDCLCSSARVRQPLLSYFRFCFARAVSVSQIFPSGWRRKISVRPLLRQAVASVYSGQ